MVKGKSALETEQAAVCHCSCSFLVCAHLSVMETLIPESTLVFCVSLFYNRQVRVLQSLFPPLLLVLYKGLLSPIASGQLAAMMLGESTSSQKVQTAFPCIIQSSFLLNLVPLVLLHSLEKLERQHFHANGRWTHAQLIQSLLETLG